MLKEKFVILFNTWFPKDSFIRNITTLVSGTVFAQLLIIIISPILTRLYSPECFGYFSYYQSISGLISAIVCWRYDIAIVIPSDNEDAVNIFFISVIICCIMSVFSLFLCIIFHKIVARMLNAPSFSIWIVFIPLTVFLAGMFQIFNYWCTRCKYFKYLAARQITQNSVMAVVQTGMGFVLRSNSIGLLCGYIIGQMAAVGRMGYNIIKNDWELFSNSINLSRIKKIFVRYKRFPLFDTWSALFNTASTIFIPLLFGVFFDAGIAGYWGLANRIISLPMIIIGNAIAQVFFQKSASIKEEQDDLRNLTESFFTFLFSLLYIPFLILFICSPYLFRVVFGIEWWKVGIYVRFLCPWTFLTLCISPLSSLYVILNKQHISMIINIIVVIIRLSIVVVSGIYFDDLIAIKLFGLGSFIFYMIGTIYIFYLIKIKFFRMIVFFIKQTMRGLPFIVPIILGILFFKNDVLVLISSLLVGFIFLGLKIKNITTQNNFLFVRGK
jgi:O-antigen/teichoic acid export membrane protein